MWSQVGHNCAVMSTYEDITVLSTAQKHNVCESKRVGGTAHAPAVPGNLCPLPQFLMMHCLSPPQNSPLSSLWGAGAFRHELPFSIPWPSKNSLSCLRQTQVLLLAVGTWAGKNSLTNPGGASVQRDLKSGGVSHLIGWHPLSPKD